METFDLNSFNAQFRPNLKQEKQATEVEILLDSKYWNKAFKLIKPATVVQIKANKGAGKDKLIPSNIALKFNTENIANGFLTTIILEHAESRALAHIVRLRMAFEMLA